jgi:hypothetical protein
MGDTDAASAPAAAPAKGRGRPKKAGAASGDAPSRGRSPRKAAEAASTAINQAANKREADGDDGPKAKRGRGRPKGTVGAKKGKKAAPKKAVGGAKRGRKPKAAATSESEAAGGETGDSGAD